jgi:cell division protein FtsB
VTGQPVMGLDAGRHVYEARHRRRRAAHRVRLALVGALLVAMLGGVGYAVYELHLENERDQQVESERIRAELDQDTTSLEDRVDQLYGRRLNGPGVPALGLEPASP